MRLVNIGYGLRRRLNDMFGRFSLVGQEIHDDSGNKITSTQERTVSIQAAFKDNIMDMALASFGLYATKQYGSVVQLRAYQIYQDINHTGKQAFVVQPFIAISQVGEVVIMRSVCDVQIDVNLAVESPVQYIMAQPVRSTKCGEQFESGSTSNTVIFDEEINSSNAASRVTVKTSEDPTMVLLATIVHEAKPITYTETTTPNPNDPSNPIVTRSANPTTYTLRIFPNTTALPQYYSY